MKVWKPHVFLTLANLFLFMAISSVADVLAVAQGQWSSWCHAHPVFMVTLSSVTPVTPAHSSSAPGREWLSKGEDFQAVVPSLIRDSFSQLWKCRLFCFKETTKKFADTLPSGHTSSLFSEDTRRGLEILLIMAWIFLSLLLCCWQMKNLIHLY